jgi:2-polyprenyl-6-methoxyphenol hydroxylase-like FAD-dependent oxidoreductase
MARADATDATPRHAVVIGGSMAGLLAARVLADRFDRVTVVERDRLPDGPEFRKGVPQSRHLHVLLGRGCAIVEDLFPGFESELLAAGAVPANWPADVLWLTAQGWSRRFDQGLRLLSASRELIEWGVRRRVAALANVEVVEGHDVTGYAADAGRGRVTGVRMRARPSTGEDGSEREMAADLVVDAGGRTSKTPRWLADLGFEPPAETRIDAVLGYASRHYAIPPEFAADWRVLYLQARPPGNARSGGLFPIEGGRWMATLAGAGRDYPPTDDAGFLEFARSLRSPVLYEAIRAAEPLTPIHGYQRTENQRRHYERMRRMPEGLLVTGDALCAFNPIYGQGMTAAAQAAQVLDRLLGARAVGGLEGLWRRFHAEVAEATAGAWLIATGEDLRYPTTAGGVRDVRTRLTHRYLDRVIRAGTEDAAVNRAFLEVLQLVAPPESLFAPGVLFPALLRGGKRPVEGNAVPGPLPSRSERGVRLPPLPAVGNR